MKHNVGGIDRRLRILAGIVILAAGLYFNSWWGLLGVIPLFTGFVRWCPAYLQFGFSSCTAEKRKKQP